MKAFLPILWTMLLPIAASFTTTPALAAGGTRPTRTELGTSWLNGSGTNAVLDKCYVHTFTLNGAQKRVIVYYTTDSPGVSNRIPDVDSDGDGTNDWAFKTAQWVQEAWSTFTGYGFRSSARTTAGDGVEEVEAWIFDLSGGLAGWCCNSMAFTLEAPMYAPGNDSSIEQVVIHEPHPVFQRD